MTSESKNWKRAFCKRSEEIGPFKNDEEVKKFAQDIARRDTNRQEQRGKELKQRIDAILESTEHLKGKSGAELEAEEKILLF